MRLPYGKPNIVRSIGKVIFGKSTLNNHSRRLIAQSSANVFRYRLAAKVSFTTTTISLLGLSVSNAKKDKMAEISEVIKHADELYKDNKFQEVYDHLIKHKDSDSVEILWRLTR